MVEALLAIPESGLGVARELRRRGVRFVVVGGWAVRFHGGDRVVDDLDLVVESGAGDALVAVLRALGGDVSRFVPSEFGAPNKQIPLKYSGCNAELLTLGDEEFEEIYRGAAEVSVGGMVLAVVSRAHLIRDKRRRDRPRDREDLRLLGEGDG